MIVEELYDALIEAGASEEKARAASRAIADMQGHFTDIRTDISELRSEVRRDIAELRSEVRRNISELQSDVEGRLRLHDCMLGTILAFLVTIFFKVFSH